MSSLLQSVLIRVATWLLAVASRLGAKRLARTETSALLAAAAVQAIDDAEERRAARATATRRPEHGQPRIAEGVLEPPPDYCAMTAKAQLSPMFGNALLLVDEVERTFVPIFVGGTEALAFRTRVEQEPYLRPLTHDLFETLLERMGARVIGMQVDELRNDTFYARLWLELEDGSRLELDARPSDAIVLAVGAGAPIYVAQDVLDQAGRRFDGSDLGGREAPG